MEANKDIVPDYTDDMCADTLDKLAKAVYIYVSPDSTEEELDVIVNAAKKAIADI